MKSSISLLNCMKWGKIVFFFFFLHLFVSFWYYYICILSRSSRTRVFLKEMLLKISENIQKNICIGVSLLSPTSSFVNEETPAQCFPKPLTIFVKSSIIYVRLGYKYASVLSPDLKLIYKDFLL